MRERKKEERGGSGEIILTWQLWKRSAQSCPDFPANLSLLHILYQFRKRIQYRVCVLQPPLRSEGAPSNTFSFTVFFFRGLGVLGFPLLFFLFCFGGGGFSVEQAWQALLATDHCLSLLTPTAYVSTFYTTFYYMSYSFWTPAGKRSYKIVPVIVINSQRQLSSCCSC